MSDKKELKHYIAKEPTQQPKFLQKYPSYDGRGILIAIIDSCIDVSLPGLQQTTTGLPKIIDCFDFTGNGDVDTSTIRKTDGDNILIGLTSRRLKIPSTWKNPSGKWHLGIKSIYELCDEDTVKSITEFRKAQISNQNQAMKKNFKFASKNDKTFMQKYLKSTVNLSNDSLVADCIVWYDGEKWLACIDTSFSGNLEAAKVLTNFRDCHEYGIILDRLTYCFTIHNDGKLLEIYATNIYHGTIIANIAAAHYPKDPEKDGLAPGAQIVSFAVIDPRGSDTANYYATTKALQKCLEMKVNIINFSLGGFHGEEYSMIKEMAEKNGTIIIKSAGNDGPIHSSLDKINSGYHHFVFECGACMTSDMTKALYEMDVDHAPIPAALSSRGPASNESNGVAFLAPGHGICDIPKCTPKEERMFGATSYCTPNAVGAIACLLSGLKAKKITISFFKLKLALINTANIPVEGDKNSFGNGIIQIYDAFDFYQTNLKNLPETINVISCKKRYKTGIVIRHTDCNITIYHRCVKINICDTSKNSSKIVWDIKVLSDYEDFVTIYPPRDDEITVKINTQSLKPNSVNYAEIHGYDSSNPSWGPLFKFPIIVFIPKILTENENINEEVTLNSITPYRIFITPPACTAQFFIKLKILEEKNVDVNIQSNNGSGSTNQEKTLNFTTDKKVNSWCFQIEDYNEVHEICLYQETKTVENTKFNLEIIFFGLLESPLKKLLNYILPIQRLPFVNILSPIKNASISLMFNQISFQIFAKGVENTIQNGRNIIKVDFYFTVTKTAKYQFIASSCAFQWFQRYFKRRFNIFTASKKFLCGICADYDDNEITLKPGKYKLIGLYEYYGWNPFVFPFISIMCELDVVVTLKKPIKPKLYLKNSNFKKSKIPLKKKLTIDEEQKLEIFYNRVSAENLSFSLPWVSSFEGTCKIFFNDTFMTFENQEQYYYQIWKMAKNVVNALLEFLQRNPTLEIEIILGNADKMIKFQNKINEFYLTNDLENLIKIVNDLLEAANIKYILQNENTWIIDCNIYERNIGKALRTTITDVIFVKTNLILDKHLRNCRNIPVIFKNKFGSDFILKDFTKDQQQHEPSIFQIWWSKIIFNLGIKSDGFINTLLHLPVLLYKNMLQIYDSLIMTFSNSPPASLEPNTTYNKLHQREVKEACSEFLQLIDDSDIRKYLILIKQALIYGEIGKALFYLNKASTENQTLPQYKIFDEVIIELLKQFGLKHLVDAHENALLDRHRNYYRPL